jgi:hypothetical protein
MSDEVISAITISIVTNGTPARYIYAVPCGDVESFLRVLKSVEGFDISVGYDLPHGEIAVYYKTPRQKRFGWRFVYLQFPIPIRK